MDVQIPSAAPSGSLHVLLLAVGLAIALPIVEVIAMLSAKAPSPTDALRGIMGVGVGVLSAHVLRLFLGLAVAVGFRCAKLHSPPLRQHCTMWNLYGLWQLVATLEQGELPNAISLEKGWQ